MFALAVRDRFDLTAVGAYVNEVDTRVAPLYHPSNVYPVVTVAVHPVAFAPQLTVSEVLLIVAIPVPLT